jgi:hypothetical protein
MSYSPSSEVDLSAITASLNTIDGIVDAILVDTGTTLPSTLATIDGIADSILTDTGSTLPATLSTIDSVVDSILVDTVGLDTYIDRVRPLVKCSSDNIYYTCSAGTMTSTGASTSVPNYGGETFTVLCLIPYYYSPNSQHLSYELHGSSLGAQTYGNTHYDATYANTNQWWIGRSGFAANETVTLRAQRTGGTMITHGEVQFMIYQESAI